MKKNYAEVYKESNEVVMETNNPIIMNRKIKTT